MESSNLKEKEKEIENIKLLKDDITFKFEKTIQDLIRKIEKKKKEESNDQNNN